MKKGLVYELTLVIAIMIIVPSMISTFSDKFKPYSEKIGTTQFSLMKAYEQGEVVLHYIDSSFGLALEDALFELAQKGGVSESCGKTVSGYSIWFSGGCAPSSEEAKINLRTIFETKISDYLKTFPPEEIPIPDYTLSINQEGNLLEMKGTADKRLRMDIGQNYNFVVAMPGEDISVAGIPSGGDASLLSPTEGKCGHVVDYAKKYIGCPYSLTITGIVTPDRCQNGLTCVGLVQSVTYHTLGQKTYGNGNKQCDSFTVTKIGLSPEGLVPGDIFAAEVYKIGGGFTDWGHTGMYVGKGYLVESSKGEGDYCWRSYTPNPNGEPIFIHSIGTQDFGRPGVCYVSYDKLFGKGTIFKLTSFCRMKKCM